MNICRIICNFLRVKGGEGGVKGVICKPSRQNPSV
jgi:hypothetical protein